MTEFVLTSAAAGAANWWSTWRSRRKQLLLYGLHSKSRSVRVLSFIGQSLAGEPGTWKEEIVSGSVIKSIRQIVETDIFESAVRGLIRQDSPLNRLLKRSV